MKNIFIKYRVRLLGAVIGSILGFLYYYFIGCANGTCKITSSPINSSIYGFVMGFLLVDLVTGRKRNK